MKKFAILAMLALELAISGCGNTPTNTVTTTTSGNWEAQLIGGTGPTSQLNFVVAFNVTDTTGIANQPLNITGVGFYNQSPCFTTTAGVNATTANGVATLNTNSAGQVTGTLNMTITSSTTGSVLTLKNGNVTGNSNGTTTTTGTLTNGVVTGTWAISGGASVPACTTDNPNLTFVMCQGTSACTAP